MHKPLTLLQRLAARAEASDCDCQTDDADLLNEAIAEIRNLSIELSKSNRDMDTYREYGDRKSEQVVAYQQSEKRLCEAIREIMKEAYQREPVMIADGLKNAIRGTALALSGRLVCIEQMCRSALKKENLIA